MSFVFEGVEVGDVGDTLGLPEGDTGFLRLKNIRIPRERMLSKYQQVTREGKYVKAERKVIQFINNCSPTSLISVFSCTFFVVSLLISHVLCDDRAVSAYLSAIHTLITSRC